jgi:hypothetical protein
MKTQIDATCDFSGGDAGLTPTCKKLLDHMGDVVGPHNVYNLYDNW